MAEYIERQKAIFPLYRWKNIIKNTYGDNDEYVRCLTEAIEKIENVPTADVAPVRHGRWTDKRTIEHDGEWYCSECNTEITIYMGPERPDRYRYCPNCGALMDKEG